MGACNARPPEGHPMHGTMVACHIYAGHDGPHTWEHEPSLARMGLNRLLALMPTRELESVDSQPPTEASEAGSWVLVTFVGGDRYGVWKRTGAVYRVLPDGSTEDDPMLTLDGPGGLTDADRAELRRAPWRVQ